MMRDIPTGTPATLTSSPCLDLFAIAQTLQQAQADQAHKGRGTAYNTLLNTFHREILPPFLAATQGNKTNAALLLGIHRSTLNVYLKNAGLEVAA